MKAAKNQPMPGLAKQSITGSDGLFGQALMRLPRSTRHEPRKAACAPVPIDQRRGAAAESAATARSAPPPPLGAPPPPPAMPTRRPRAARGRSAGRRRRAGWPRAARSPCCRSRRPAARSTRCRRRAGWISVLLLESLRTALQPPGSRTHPLLLGHRRDGDCRSGGVPKAAAAALAAAAAAAAGCTGSSTGRSYTNPPRSARWAPDSLPLTSKAAAGPSGLLGDGA